MTRRRISPVPCSGLSRARASRSRRSSTTALVAGALLTGRTGPDVGAVRGLPAEGGEPLKRGRLDIGFGEGGHGLLPESYP